MTSPGDSAGDATLPESLPEHEGGGSPGTSSFQEVAKHSLIYGAGIIAGRAVSFLMLPIYTRYLTPADYGVLALIEMTLDFIAIIAGGTLAMGVFRFYHKAKTEREREEVVSTSFLMISGMYTLVGVTCLLAAVPLSQLVFGSPGNSLLFRVASANLALGAFAIVPLAFARVRDRSMLFVGANLVRLVLAVGFNLLFLVALGLGVLGVLLSTLISSTTVGLALTLWLVRTVGFAWSPSAARKLLRYGVPLMATTVATFIATFSDRFFLNAAADETAVGLYNLGYMFGFLLVMIGFTPVDMVWGPRRFKAAAEPDRDRILARGFVLINVLLLSVAVAISLFVHDLLRVMADPAFHGASRVVPLILLAYIFQCWASIQDIGILVSERTEYVTVANFTSAGVAVAGYVLLIPPFLAWGAAVATVAALLTRYLLTFFFAQRLWPVRYRWRPVVMLAGLAGAVAGAGLLLPDMTIFASVSVRSALGLVFLWGVWVLPILEDEDRRAGLETAREVLAFVRRLPRSAAS